MDSLMRCHETEAVGVYREDALDEMDLHSMWRHVDDPLDFSNPY